MLDAHDFEEARTVAHHRAKLTPLGRRQLVRAVEEEGKTFQAAAAAWNVAPATAHTWVWRWRRASAEERRTLACLSDRPSRPHTSPRRLSAAEEAHICEARRRTGWGPRLLALEAGRPHQTVWRVLHRHGVSRRPKAPRAAERRYEWPCPGDLLHMDVKRYPRFLRPGHAVTGDRSKTYGEKANPLGHDHFHAIVDDRSRLAYGELLADERSATVTAFVERALRWFQARGIAARRVMTDGAWSYTRNRSLAELLAGRGIRHLVTRPYTPRTTARSSASTRPWSASGRRASSTPHTRPATPPCHTGFRTTTSAGPTARWAGDLPSLAFGRARGRTADMSVDLSSEQHRETRLAGLFRGRGRRRVGRMRDARSG